MAQQLVPISSSGVRKLEYSEKNNLLAILCAYTSTQNFFVIYEYDLKERRKEKKKMKPLQFQTPIMYNYLDEEKVNHMQFIDKINKNDGTRLVTGSEQGMVRIHQFKKPFTQSGTVTYEKQFYAEPIKMIKKLNRTQMKKLYNYLEYNKMQENKEHEGPDTSNWVIISYPKAIILLNVETFDFQAYWMEQCKQINDMILTPNYSKNRQSLLRQLEKEEEEETPINSIHDMIMHTKCQIFVVGQTPSYGFLNLKQDEKSKKLSVRHLAKSFTHSVFSLASTLSSKNYNMKASEPLTMGLEQSFFDEPREIIKIAQQPAFRFALTTDLLGRILLIDLCTSTVIYIWKGYRSSHCVWLNDSLFCIVAPQRCAMEIWEIDEAHQPSRMKSIKLPESDLIYIHHSLIDKSKNHDIGNFEFFLSSESGSLFSLPC